MELLLVAGVVAGVVLGLLAVYMFIQQRRSGTVRAVLSRTSSATDDGQPDSRS